MKIHFHCIKYHKHAHVHKEKFTKIIDLPHKCVVIVLKYPEIFHLLKNCDKLLFGNSVCRNVFAETFYPKNF